VFPSVLLKSASRLDGLYFLRVSALEVDPHSFWFGYRIARSLVISADLNTEITKKLITCPHLGGTLVSNPMRCL